MNLYIGKKKWEWGGEEESCVFFSKHKSHTVRKIYRSIVQHFHVNKNAAVGRAMDYFTLMFSLKFRFAQQVYLLSLFQVISSASVILIVAGFFSSS